MSMKFLVLVLLAVLTGCGAVGGAITGGLVGGSMEIRHDGGAPVEYH